MTAKENIFEWPEIAGVPGRQSSATDRYRCTAVIGMKNLNGSCGSIADRQLQSFDSILDGLMPTFHLQLA